MSAYALSTPLLTQRALAVNQLPYATTVQAPVARLRVVKEIAATSASVWKNYIDEDAQGLLRALQRMVGAHPLVRSALKGQRAALGASLLFSTQDIAQDLYLILLQKERFRHYLESAMTDAEIEREIYQVELTNYLIGILRRCRPENYRMVRRISAVLENDARFRLLQTDGRAVRYRQSGAALYGLAEWLTEKTVNDSNLSAALIAHISMRQRDLRRVGCSGDTQVIISNQELAVLLAEILQAIDTPAPLRVLRQLALSKLPAWDVTLTPIETDAGDERLGGARADMLSSEDANPEESMAQDEEAVLARHAAQAFLSRLHASTKENLVRTERLWRVLWHCYFDPAEPSQLSIAAMIGVSDSSIGDYRRKLELEMRRLSLSFTQVAHFSEALRQELRTRLFVAHAGNGTTLRAVRGEVEVRKAGVAALPLLAVPRRQPSQLNYAQV